MMNDEGEFVVINTECYDLASNCYFVTDTEDNAALVIDPGSPSEKLQKRIDDFGAEKLQYILLTHGHYDHIGNAAALKARYPHAVIVIG